MFSLVNILIVFFLFLIIYQLFLANRVIEGLSNSSSSSSSDSDDIQTLVHKNAAEIQIINEHLLDPVNQQISTINTTLTSLQNQINQLATSIKQMSQNMPGQQPVTSGSSTSSTSTTSTTSS
jgi:uncharacterized protein YoxC